MGSPLPTLPPPHSRVSGAAPPWGQLNGGHLVSHTGTSDSTAVLLKYFLGLEPEGLQSECLEAICRSHPFLFPFYCDFHMSVSVCASRLARIPPWCGHLCTWTWRLCFREAAAWETRTRFTFTLGTALQCKIQGPQCEGKPFLTQRGHESSVLCFCCTGNENMKEDTLF